MKCLPAPCQLTKLTFLKLPDVLPVASQYVMHLSLHCLLIFSSKGLVTLLFVDFQVTLKGSSIHPSIAKSLDIIKEKFERLCLRDQDILGTPERWNKVV